MVEAPPGCIAPAALDRMAAEAGPDRVPVVAEAALDRARAAVPESPGGGGA